MKVWSLWIASGALGFIPLRHSFKQGIFGGGGALASSNWIALRRVWESA